MPTFRDKTPKSNRDPFFGYDDLHLGHKVPLVEGDDIRDKSITGENIAPGAVTAEKIAPGSVGHEQLAPEAVEDLTRLEGELAELINGAQEFLQIEVMNSDDVTSMMDRVLGRENNN